MIGSWRHLKSIRWFFYLEVPHVTLHKSPVHPRSIRFPDNFPNRLDRTWARDRSNAWYRACGWMSSTSGANPSPWIPCTLWCSHQPVLGLAAHRRRPRVVTLDMVLTVNKKRKKREIVGKQLLAQSPRIVVNAAPTGLNLHWSSLFQHPPWVYAHQAGQQGQNSSNNLI